MNDLPYQEIPAPPETYSAGTVLASTMDSLGFRYRWSTEGLTEKELSYRPAKGCRSGLVSTIIGKRSFLNNGRG